MFHKCIKPTQNWNLQISFSIFHLKPWDSPAYFPLSCLPYTTLCQHITKWRLTWSEKQTLLGQVARTSIIAIIQSLLWLIFDALTTFFSSKHGKYSLQIPHDYQLISFILRKQSKRCHYQREDILIGKLYGLY